MKVTELIEKYKMRYVIKDGVECFGYKGKLSKEQVEELKTAKPEIMKELKKIEQEKTAKIEEKKRQHELEIENFKKENKIIKTYQRDGEYDSSIHGIDAISEEILQSLNIPNIYRMVEALGTEFTYQQVIEYMNPINEVKKEVREEKIANIFETAKLKNEKQLLNSYSEPCNDKNEDCDIDNVCEWAMPNGATTVTRQHTW